MLTGRISNASFGGALVTSTAAQPPKGALVVVDLGEEPESVTLQARVTSSLIRAVLDGLRRRRVGTFGVKFVGTEKEVRSKLKVLL